MTLSAALLALKKRDFAAARDIVAQGDRVNFTLEHFLILGLSLLALEDWQAAREVFTAATGRFPEHALCWLNRGIAEERLGLWDDAVASQEKCVALNPAQAEAYGNLSNLYRKQRRFAEAERMARQALANGAAKAEALNILGLALGAQGKFAEADAVFVEGHQADPGNAMVIFNRGNLAADQLDFNKAWPLFTAARALNDNAVFRHDEGLVRLLAGDYAIGWPLYEARLEMPGALRVWPDCPRWNGERLAGKKLLIVAEQGYGDVIQFCRYQKFLPDVELVWAVPSCLLRLLSGVVRGTVVDEAGPLPACDYYVPMMSLPLVTRQFQPVATEYNLKTASGPALPAGRHPKKIGLVWAGSRTHLRDHDRSLPVQMLAPVLQAVEADFYAPFLGKALEDIGDLPIMRLDHLIGDFADTAALLKQMDLVIAVDTAVAHLAGALGVRTFLLLPHCPDWRWGVCGEMTAWYKSMTLLRQPRYGDWDSVIARLSELLKRGF